MKNVFGIPFKNLAGLQNTLQRLSPKSVNILCFAILALAYFVCPSIGFAATFSLDSILGLQPGTLPPFPTAVTSLGGMVRRVTTDSFGWKNIFAGAAYLGGVWLTLSGLVNLKNHVTDPEREPMVKGLVRLGAAGLLFVLPAFLLYLTNTFYDTTAMPDQIEGFVGPTVNAAGSPSATTATLDTIMANFVRDLSGPVKYAVAIFSYIIGILFGMVGIGRLLRLDSGPKTALSTGTFGIFITSALLLLFAQFVVTIQITLFGIAGESVTSALAYNFGAPDLMARANNALNAVVGFIGIVGYISVLRGLLMVRSFADGDEKDISPAIIHMIGGAIAINLAFFVGLMEKTINLNLIN